MAEPLKGSVLLVDDDPAVAKVLGALLAQAGLTVAHAPRRGGGAGRCWAQKPIDVVVSDVRMPGMSGLELLAEVTRAYPDVPVVLITAHGTVPHGGGGHEGGRGGLHPQAVRPGGDPLHHPQGAAARAGRAASARR